MGIFDFFKKKATETEVKAKEIKFEDITKWLEERENLLRNNEQRTLEQIGERLGEFYGSIDSKLNILTGIDIESKKEHGRAKLLVRQGLDSYVASVRVLLRDLKNIQEDNLEKFVLEVGRLFEYFEKTSAIFYGRANYLIGDEMAAVRNEIRKFYNGLVETFEGKESSIIDLKSLREFKSKLEEFGKGKIALKESNEEIERIIQKIEKLKKSVDKLMKEIEKIRGSLEYTLNLKTEDEIKSLRTKIDNEIVKLKELIDFKKLTHIVHTNEKEMNIIKEYKEHFVAEFSRDGGKKILNLLENSNMKSSDIDTRVSLIKKLNDELKDKREKIGLDPTILKLREVKRIEDEIDSLETEKVRVKRRIEDLDLKLQGLKHELVNLIAVFGVSVV